MNIPEINKVYNYFDDGKIRESRRMSVTITDIVLFNLMDEEILSLWKEEVKDCCWLYAEETDFFIIGDLKISDNRIEKIVFVRTKNNGWFSLGYWGGELDVDGSLMALLKN